MAFFVEIRCSRDGFDSYSINGRFLCGRNHYNTTTPSASKYIHIAPERYLLALCLEVTPIYLNGAHNEYGAQKLRYGPHYMRILELSMMLRIYYEYL